MNLFYYTEPFERKHFAVLSSLSETVWSSSWHSNFINYLQNDKKCNSVEPKNKELKSDFGQWGIGN